jgi:PIN domain nuclease of toxin-antitoxin system
VRRYVLDTHALIYMLQRPARLGRAARQVLRQLEAGRVEAWLPAATVAETVVLHQLGRTDADLAAIQGALEDYPSLRFLPLDLDQLDVFSSLAGFRDPFDRLIVSAARHLGAQLITRDGDIGGSGLVRTVWT